MAKGLYERHRWSLEKKCARLDRRSYKKSSTSEGSKVSSKVEESSDSSSSLIESRCSMKVIR
jgi:hypothetical protein